MASGDPLFVLETRMARLEATVFGSKARAHLRPPLSAEDAPSDDGDLHARTARIACHIPSLPGQRFEALLAQLGVLGLDSTSAIRRELVIPLEMTAKKVLIAANEDVLRRLSVYGTKVGALSSTVGGNAWALGRDETLQLEETEARVGELVRKSSSISQRVDSMLETYESAVGTVSEKLILYNEAAPPRDSSP